MKRIETVSLIGLGAVGCTLFEKLAATASSFRVIASDGRAARLRERGVLINGVRHTVPVVEPKDKVAAADLILLAVKNTQLDQAVQDMAGHVGPGTVILPLLNGVVSEEVVGRKYGMEKVLYAYVVGIDATRVGEDTRFQNAGTIPFGEARNPPDKRAAKVDRVAGFFTRAGISYRIPENMLHSLWSKFMFNVGVNQVSAVLGADYGAFQAHESVRALHMDAMMEAVAVARAENIPLTREDAEATLDILDSIAPEGKTSMLQDIEAGRKTEVDMFGKTVMDLGRKHGIPTPVNEMLVRLIRAKEDIAFTLH